jgi:hypothetical protein
LENENSETASGSTTERSFRTKEKKEEISVPYIKALFIWVIIRLIQLVFSAGTVFFSQKKSVNSVFQPAYNSSRTDPKLIKKERKC